MEDKIKIQFDHQHFTNQEYGGISRYFANIQDSLDKSNDFSYDRGLWITRNYYLKHVRFPLRKQLKNFPKLNNYLINYIFEKYEYDKIYQWNNEYSLECIRKNNFDVFHPTYYDPYFIYDIKKPIVITVHDLIHEKFPMLFPRYDGTTHQKRMVFERANHFIAISESTKKDLMEYYKIPEEKISVIYHGHFPLIGDIQSAKNQHGNYILFVGDRTNYKNFINFIYAVKDLLITYNDIKVIFAGGGDFASVESEIILHLGLKNKVEYIKIDDYNLKVLYKHALVYVNPSLYEGFGLPILEAFAEDCPTILSNTSCFKEVGGNAAVYFDPNDSECIKQAINSVIFNSSLRNNLILNGREQLKKFSIEDSMEKTKAVYRKVVNENS